MSIEIYYFSGTGNSLHVARELQVRLSGSKLLPIINLLQQEKIKTHAHVTGFVFPNFCLSIPIPLKKFLDKSDLRSSNYLFAVCTRGGTPSEAHLYINDLLALQNKTLNAWININMPWNHPMGKENLIASVSKKMKEKMEQDMCKKLDVLSKKIIAREDYHEKDNDITMKLPFISLAIQKLFSRAKNYAMHAYMYEKKVCFYSDENCKGCGTCEQVCLSNRIKIIDKKPVWKDEPLCYGCFACINYCPQQAVQVKSRFPVLSWTRQNPRYHHPKVSAKDIAAQHKGAGSMKTDLQE